MSVSRNVAGGVVAWLTLVLSVGALAAICGVVERSGALSVVHDAFVNLYK